MRSAAHAIPNSNSDERLSFSLRLLARVMRSMPTDIRRVDMIWRSLYRQIEGGGFEPNGVIDPRWPAGLQDPIRGKQHGLLMRLNLQNWADRRAYFSGLYFQQDISRLYLAVLRAGDQYLDVGANIGMTALLASSRIGPTGKGFAFEPNPVVYRRLKEHLELNRATNIEPAPFAVADRESVDQLFVPGDENQLGTLAPEEGVAGNYVEVRTVPGDRYAALFDSAKPTFIKIDVEGFEVQVLNGIRSLLSWPEVVLVAEISDAMLRRAGHSRAELHAILQSQGFLPFGMSVQSSRWRKELQLRPLSGPLETDKYDAVFVRPGSEIHRRRIAPLLKRSATDG